MKIKQEDIAKELGISRTTVARALNGGAIKEETKEKILKLIEKKGYKKNIISSTLAMKKEMEVYCFLVKSLNENYCGELKKGLLKAQEEFKSYNFKIKIVETLINEPKNQIIMLKEIIETKNLSGIIITPLLKKEIYKILKENEKKIKIITLDIPIDEKEIHVGADYFKSGKVAARIMNELLRKDEKILLFDADDDNISSKLYYRGFREEIEKTNREIVDGGVLEKNISDKLDIVKKMIEEEKYFGLYTPRYLQEFVPWLLKNDLQNEKIKIVGNGNSEILKKYLDNGSISVLIKENNFLEGYTAGVYMFDYLFKGIKPEKKSVKTEPIIIFKECL